MKKNILSIVSILLVFSVLFCLVACGKKADDEFVTETETQTVVYYVDDKGERHDVETTISDDGATHYAYVDEGGKKVVIEDEAVVVETTVVTVTKRVTTTKKNKNRTTTNLDEEASRLIADLGFDPGKLGDTGETITMPISDETLPEGSTVKVELDSSGMPVAPKARLNYGEILKSGTYTINFDIQTTQGGTKLTIPVTLAAKNGKLFARAKMPVTEVTTMPVEFLNDGNKCYFVIPGMGYIESDSSMLDEIIGAANTEIDANAVYVDTTEVNYKGRKYTCETYEIDGNTCKYYFYNGAIMRIENVDSATGDIAIMDITTISGNAADSLFVLSETNNLGEKLESMSDLDDFGDLVGMQ